MKTFSTQETRDRLAAYMRPGNHFDMSLLLQDIVTMSKWSGISHQKLKAELLYQWTHVQIKQID